MAVGSLPSTFSLYTSGVLSSSRRSRGTDTASVTFNFKRHSPICFSSNKNKPGFVDQILDYIEGGPKLRKWYGAPDLLPQDGSILEENMESPEKDEVRDAVLVTDGDNEIGQPMTGDANDRSFQKKALRGVRAIICPNEGFLSQVESLKGVQHVILLSQLSVYRVTSGIQAFMNSKARKLAEQDESTVMASGIPYTIIRTGSLQNTPGGKQGFSFEEGSAAQGSLSKEDAAFICMQALDAVPQRGLTFEVVNGEEKVSDWKEFFAKLMEKAEPQLQ